MSWIYWSLCWILMDTSFITAMNLRTNKFEKFKGKPNSYFGFSIVFHRTINDTLLLVGAPKANQEFLPEVQNPGTIFRCSLQTNTCSEVTLENFGNQEGKILSNSYADHKDHGWYGVTVNSFGDGGDVVTCGHRWMNRFSYNNWHRGLSKEIPDFWANGMCYTLDKNLNPNSVKRMIPLLDLKKQTDDSRPIFAFGAAGMSAHFVESRDALLLGAPGVDDWSGSIIYIRKPYIQNSENFAKIWKPERRRKDYNVPYFGYSVTSAKFRHSDPESLVVGAPRWDYFGKVFVVQILQNQFIITNEWKGEQFGEYFGASVCTVDVNNDELPDVLIGSPLYKSSERDEGIVTVFINQNSNKFRKQGILEGSKAAGSRFGMAIANIGDLNKDDYNDVVIGAPYENDIGAIYIYHGGPHGMKLNFSQRVFAQDLGREIRGFGISFSTGFDANKDSFNDVAVGSYESDQAFLFYGQPSIKLFGEIEFKPQKINIRSFDCYQSARTCFNITTCIHYTWNYKPNTINSIKRSFKSLCKNFPGLSETKVKVGVLVASAIRKLLKDEVLKQKYFVIVKKFDINTNLNIDTLYRFYKKRAFLEVDGENKMEHQEIIKIKSTDKKKCRTYRAVLKENLKDITSFITVTYSFSLSSQQPVKDFPYMLDPESPTSISNSIPLVQPCSQNCDTDLELTAEFLLHDKSKLKKIPVFVGANYSLSVLVEVKNNKGSPIFTQLNVTHPQGVKFIRFSTDCQENPPKGLLCNLNNLPKPFKDIMILDLNWKEIEKQELNIKLKVTNANEDRNPDNNDVTLTILARIEADITISGVSSREFIHFSQGSTAENNAADFFHKYEIRNLGPSPIDEVSLEIDVPFAALQNRDLVFLNITSIEDCRNSECRKFGCSISNLKGDDKVIVIVNMRVDRQKLLELEHNGAVVDIYTQGSVTITTPTENIQPKNHDPDTAKVKASFDTGRAPASHVLPDWVIPVSIIVGMLLIILVMLGLYKLGFFNRKEREALKSLMHSAKVESNLTESTALRNSRSQLLED